MTTKTTVLELLGNEGITLENAKHNVFTFFKHRRNTNSRNESKNYIRFYKALKQYDGLTLNDNKLGFEFVGENLVSDDLDMANRIINLHSDYSYNELYTHSVASERAFISKTYRVTFSKVPNYSKFLQSLLFSIKNNGCKKFPIVSFEEFSNKKMANGQKIGRYLSRCGIDNSFIGNLDHLLQCDDSVKYFTISGATQHIIGMSYFLEDETSCQNWDDNSNIGYALHNLAGSQTKEQFVSFLHNELNDLEHGFCDEFMLSRTTILRALESDVPIFYHGKIYGHDRQLHKQVIEALDGHFNSFYEREKGGERFTYRLQGGNHVTVATKDIYEMTISNEQGSSFSVTCPMCDGDGTIRNDVHLQGEYMGRVDMDCPLCEGSGDHELELDYDFDGDNATDYASDDDLQDLCENESYFKFYDAHAFEGFSDNDTSVVVYAPKTDVMAYVRKIRLDEGKGFLLENERVQLFNGLISYKYLANIDSFERLEDMSVMELLEKFVSVFGLVKLSENKDLLEYYNSNK